MDTPLRLTQDDITYASQAAIHMVHVTYKALVTPEIPLMQVANASAVGLLNDLIEDRTLSIGDAKMLLAMAMTIGLAVIEDSHNHEDCDHG